MNRMVPLRCPGHQFGLGLTEQRSNREPNWTLWTPEPVCRRVSEERQIEEPW